MNKTEQIQTRVRTVRELLQVYNLLKVRENIAACEDLENAIIVEARELAGLVSEAAEAEYWNSKTRGEYECSYYPDLVILDEAYSKLVAVQYPTQYALQRKLQAVYKALDELMLEIVKQTVSKENEVDFGN